MGSKFRLVIAAIGAALAVTFGGYGTPVFAACDANVLGIPAWYNNLPMDGNCGIQSPSTSDDTAFRKFVLVIILNVVQAALMIVGYIAVIFIIKGGYLYVLARGESGNVAAAKQTITNAIIGLIIALLSAGIVGAVSGAMG